MDNFEHKPLDENSLIGNAEINGYLFETSKWGKFLAIIGYIGMVLLVLLGIFMMLGLSHFGNLPDTGFPMGVFGLLYIFIALIYYFPVNYLYKFSVQIKQGLQTKDTPTVTSGFQNLKSLFKFMGIFTIVILSIYGLLLLIAIPTMLLLRP
jgi:hypothetical protein